MCGPILSFIGSRQAARGAEQVGSYNAEVARLEGDAAQQQAEFSAQVAEAEARQAREAAAFDEGQRRERARFMLSDQRQRFLASGVDLEGSPLEVLAFNAGQAELDALSARYEGEVRAQSLTTEAAARRYQGRVAQTQARAGAGMALLQGRTAAASARLRGVAELANTTGQAAAAAYGAPSGSLSSGAWAAGRSLFVGAPR